MCRASNYLFMVQPDCMNQEEYLALYEKYIAGLCSPEEEEQLYTHMDGFKMLESDLQGADQADLKYKDQLFEKINQTIEAAERPKIIRLAWFKYAAVLLLTLAAGYLFIDNKQLHSGRSNTPKQAHVNKATIKPGRNTATLTLSDGAVLDLENLENGMIASTGGTQVKKSADGSIVYQVVEDDSNPGGLNTIAVPAGGQYQVILPDGTAVWLNALSSLTYPTAFKGKSREVTLRGEAYFEVAKDPSKPFIARVDEMQIRVLGTHFNIDAYDAKRYRTTLLEGSVQVSKAHKTALLKPGQQSVLNFDNESIKVAEVNVNKTVAWKNGYFMFQDDKIKDIMAQISRWYDVEVEFEGAVSQETFGGIYSRNKDINELLKGLELTGLVRFKIEGRRIIVMS